MTGGWLWRVGGPVLGALTLLAAPAAIVPSQAGFTSATSIGANPFAAATWLVPTVALGDTHACAALSSGAGWCWARNNSGQVGDGSTFTRLSPVTVVGVGGGGSLSGVTAVAAAKELSCAATASGSAYCWGKNDRGQLGTGTTSDSTTPVEVVGSGGDRRAHRGAFGRRRGEARLRRADRWDGVVLGGEQLGPAR